MKSVGNVHHISLVVLLCLEGSSIASVTHKELFDDFADRFDMECYSVYDECYLYFSDDDICWVEVYGDSSCVESVLINTEPGYESEIAIAYEYQNHFLFQTVPSLVNQGWLTQVISQWQNTHRTQITRVGNIDVKFYMESLGDGLMGLNTEIIFQ